LNPTPNTSRLNLNVFACAARLLAGVGRFLLLLTILLLVTTPLTQHIWIWDHFLQGGQDYESSTLVILAFLCLVLVLTQHCKQSVDMLFATRRLFSFIPHDLLLASITPVGVISAMWTERVASPGLEIYSLPLQI
jgi:hypothetical protein